ncbi:MAG: CHAT domain-containing tetratricopeptide repeat protein [Bacteroidia bacterium]|nr:CHAT domain-containing tetratricopeptide repeat protein [Bacteroidia bacterium]
MKLFGKTGGFRVAVFLILLLGSGKLFYAQSSVQKDSLEGERLFALAQKDTALDRQVLLYRQASRHFRSANLPLRWWACLDNISTNLFDQERDDETLAWMDTAVAETWWPEDLKTATIIAISGYYNKLCKDYYNSKKAYEKAVEITRKYTQLECRHGRTSLKSLGNLYTQFGEYEKARQLLEEALSLCEDYAEPSTPAAIISDLGVVYRFLGEWDSALALYDRGLKIKGIDANTQGLLLSNKAEVLHIMGKNKEALPLAQKAIAVIEKAEEPNGRYREAAYTVLGAIYEEMGNRTEAMKYFYGAIDIGKEMYGDEPRRETGKIYQALGEIALEDKNFVEAEKFFSNAVETIVPGLKPKILNNPRPVADNVLMSGLEGLGATAWESYQKTGDKTTLQTAYTRYRQSIRVQNVLRESFSYESSRLKLQEESILRNEYAIAAAFELHRITREASWLDSAFSFFEESKSVTLKTSLQEIEAGKASVIPRVLLDKRKELSVAHAQYEAEIFNIKASGDTANTRLITRLEKQLSQINISLDSVHAEIKDRFASWYQLQYASSRTNISQLQTWLADHNSQMIQYFWGETWLFVLSVDRTGIRSHKIPMESSNLTHKIDSLRLILGDYSQAEDEKLANIYFTEYTRLSYELYQLLLGEVLPENNSSKPQKLIIVPDGLLGYLPFDVLLSAPAGDKTGYRNLDYVLNDFIVRYAYSADLCMMENIPTGKATAVLGGYAPVYSESWLADARRFLRMNDIRAYNNLEYNRPEVETISGMMDGESFIGEAATEAAFRASAGRFRILHLSMHGFANEENPLYSGLVFSINDKSGERADPSGVRSQGPGANYVEEENMNINKEDGFLHAYEIFGLNLQAEMAVLSACKTGLGKLIRGEGIMSLARAFRVAGCPNVVMSLWEADDQSTKEIMEKFYANLKTGMPKDEALHNAKVDYIHSTTDGTRINPLYWSTFVLIGDGNSVLERDYSSLFFFLGGGLILAILLLAIFFNRRKPREHI